MAASRMENVHVPRYFSTQILGARRFHLPTKKPPNAGLWVVGGGLEHCRPDYRIERSTFPCLILEFVAGGSGTLWLAGKSYPLVPGHWFSYGPGLRHRMVSDPDHPLVKYFIMLAGPAAKAALRAHRALPGTVARVAQPDRITPVLDDLIAFGLGDRADRAACCARALDYLLLKLTAQMVHDSAPPARAFHTYQRCRQHLERHALTLRSLDEVATACHVDNAYLCRLFQRFGRERPGHYLQHIRMNHAMTQLQTSDRLIKTIALELGFSDPANFTRAFRRWFGVPPQALRQ